jgi:hypothetical protein
VGEGGGGGRVAKGDNRSVKGGDNKKFKGLKMLDWIIKFFIFIDNFIDHEH